MKYFYLIAAFNALFFTILILQKRKAFHDKILIFWLTYLGLYTGLYALFSKTLFVNFHLLSASFISLLLLHGPFLYLYISALIKEGFKFSYRQLFHFVPFVLFNLFLAGSLFFPELSERIRLDHTSEAHNTPLVFNLFLAITVLSGPVYFIRSINLFKKLDIDIFNNFSTSDNIKLDWLRKLVYLFGSIWTVLMAFIVIHHVFSMFSWYFCTDGLFLSLSVFIILLGYFGLRQKEIFIHYPDIKAPYVTESKPKYSGVLLSEKESEMYLSKLMQFMNEEKPYLNPELSLPELAQKLQIPSHHLSRVINEKTGLNFFDFVNKYRIEEVKLKIVSPEFNNLSILGIAFDSGFNSKSAFNRVFKKATGITPSDYKEQTNSLS